jgi:hypothetical protein
MAGDSTMSAAPYGASWRNRDPVRGPSLWGCGVDGSSTKRFHIVESPWLPGGDEVTPTMKLKRRVINRKYAPTISALYADKE